MCAQGTYLHVCGAHVGVSRRQNSKGCRTSENKADTRGVAGSEVRCKVSFQKRWREDAVLHPGNVLRMQRIMSVHVNTKWNVFLGNFPHTLVVTQ